MSATTLELELGGRTVRVSRPDKLLFPRAGITKGDLAEYYLAVAEVMLPHLRSRPLSFERRPDGVDGSGFVQKAVPRHYPGWIERVEVAKQGGTITQVVVDREPGSLIYLADQACITVHRWLSTTATLERPDQVVLDLDPSGDDVSLVRAAARDVRAILLDIGLRPFLMTTGSRGYHVVCPIAPDQGFDEARALAHDVALLAAQLRPEAYTLEWSKSQRRGRVFLDYLRNGYAQTAVAPYSVRSRPGAGVATPIDWEELPRTAPDAYGPPALRRRLRQKRDPWHDMDRYQGSLPAARRALDDLLGQQASRQRLSA